jgi:hypothetical protein
VLKIFAEWSDKREMLYDRREFIYRHGMEQIFSNFILSHVSFGSFLAPRKEQNNINNI